MYQKEFDLIFDTAKKMVDSIEIFLTAEKAFSVKISKQEIESFNYTNGRGLGIRVIKNGKIGYSYTEEFSKDAFKTIINEALENSKIITSTDETELELFPDTEVQLDFFNKNLEEVELTDKIHFAKNLEKLAYEKDKRIKIVPYAMYSDIKLFTKIANSKGLNKEYTTNAAYCFLSVLAADGDKKRMGSDFFFTRNFKEFDAQKLVDQCTDQAISLLYDRPVDKTSCPVVFNNVAMSSLLSTFSKIFSAESVLQGKSLLSDKLDSKIANNLVNIVDDPLLSTAFSSRPFDSEGYPCRKIRLVDNGLLKTFLHNTKTAKKMNTKSTGHASRTYKSSLDVSSSNFYLEPGNLKNEDLFTRHNQVIEVVSLQGMHSGANPVSGDFSLSAEGFLWENGKRVSSLENFTVSGNFLTVLHDIEAIADNLRFSPGSFGSAAVLVKKLNISG